MKNMNNLLENAYLRYTEEDLEIELNFLNNKEQNPRLSLGARKQVAGLKVELLEAYEVFAEVQKLGLDTSGMTAEDIIETISGRTVGELNSSYGTTIALRVDDAWDKSLDSAKKGLNKVGAWLVSVTEGGKK